MEICAGRRPEEVPLGYTCHATSYPNSSNELRMAANVLPESCDNNPGTFSSSRYLGFLTAAILAISKNRVPLASNCFHVLI